MRSFAAISMLAVLCSQSVLAILPPQVSATEVLAGKADPTSIKPADLPDGTTPVNLTLSAPTSYADIFQMFSFGGFGVGISDAQKALFSYLGTYWLTDKEVAWKGGTYLLAYQCDIGNEFMARIGRTTDKLPEIKLHLVLINKASIAVVTPRPEQSKAGFLKAIEGVKESGGQGDKAKAVSYVKEVGIASLIYVNDNDDVLPATHSTGQTLNAIWPYIKNKEIYRSLNPNGGQILYNLNLSGVNSTLIANPAVEPLFYDSLAWPDGGRPVVFADGHAKYVTAEEWPAVVTELNRKYKKVAKPVPAGKPKR